MRVQQEPWFAWTIAIIVLLPIATLALSEVHLRLARRGSSLARPVNRLRIWLMPTTALFIVLTRAGDLSSENNGVRVVATMVGLIAVSVALGLLNAVLFDQASEGSWQARLPSIFIDLARLVMILAGAAIVASFVWGLDVGGLVAALGVGTIVIGLALQNAVGSVVSGLLLLFEQPFVLGDTLTVGTVTGRVVEMNWRSTHINTGAGIQIIPNASIAGGAFTNLSRPSPEHDLVIETTFAATDVPHQVTSMLLDVADEVPYLRPGATPSVTVGEKGAYSVVLPLATASDSAGARSNFRTWLWYAARRRGLCLDGATHIPVPAEDVRSAVDASLNTLNLSAEELDALAATSRVVAFGSGEAIVKAGEIATSLCYVLTGLVVEMLRDFDGSLLEVAEHTAGDAFGVEAVLREKSATRYTARGVVTVLEVPADAVDKVVARHPAVARRLNALATLHENQRQGAQGTR